MDVESASKPQVLNGWFTIMHSVVDAQLEPENGAYHLNALISVLCPEFQSFSQQFWIVCDACLGNPVRWAYGGIESGLQPDNATDALVRVFWGYVIKIARDISYHDNERQARLVDLIHALAHLVSAGDHLGNCGSDGMENIDPLKGSVPMGPFLSLEFDREEWINRTSFMARMMGRQLRSWKMFAIWELRSALEYPQSIPDGVDFHVGVVREWILHAGAELYRQRKEGVLTECEQRSTSPGPLYYGKADLCLERWAFWKERLLDLAKDASPELQKTAVSVVEHMNDIEDKAQGNLKKRSASAAFE
ncbi:DUF3632 domain-containing protein [Aspergillus saccharolyticus JOP 1030-1]|uniref:Uncharacterized protein n=1 Tax=Aspergillus saccharolyticus JOP 1030-1 TaxID=1450539 RepID=A0A318ZIQ2_9EURO|nr:hypothetical protein BP01DRAFT_397446 [Aspergillus saccharolyticus JOP 1030-1]PYH46224.1 hypothetical protein BP01DRAFT_397446 [Aspergillus saccharolyticus JOP 1030-1]